MFNLPDVRDTIEILLETEIRFSKQLHGGDINNTFFIKTDSDDYVVKINSAQNYPGMFEAEKIGLKTLESTNTIRVPKSSFTGQGGGASFLIMEYIPQGRKAPYFWEIFGQQLAQLHHNSRETFGFSSDNYIGSLKQHNDRFISIQEFYITQRIDPQIRLAKTNGYEFKNSDSFYKELENLIPHEKPALVHGDLWNGNYLIDPEGKPCLIDPAICYMHRETDIAMMHLFGGFEAHLFESYQEIYPLEKGWQKRLDIWQLYYLLVHLNLFGSSYYSSVLHILNKYA